MDLSCPDDPCYLSSRSIKIKFASRFLQALKKINKRRSISNSMILPSVKEMSRRCRRVRMAADASMASAVGPRKAWSRAMLTKLIRSRRIHGPTPPAAARIVQDTVLRSPTKLLIKRVAKKKQQGLAQIVRPVYPNRADELRRLVPGGEAMDLYGLLDETAHYIKCLTTQVNVMKSIVTVCSTTA